MMSRYGNKTFHWGQVLLICTVSSHSDVDRLASQGSNAHDFEDTGQPRNSVLQSHTGRASRDGTKHRPIMGVQDSQRCGSRVCETLAKTRQTGASCETADLSCQSSQLQHLWGDKPDQRMKNDVGSTSWSLETVSAICSLLLGTGYCSSLRRF